MRTLSEIRRSLAGRAWKVLTRYPVPPAPPPSDQHKAPLPRSELAFHSPGQAELRGRWPMSPILQSTDTGWARVLRRLYDSPLSFPACISPDGGLLLYALVRNIRPRRIIETGTYIGVSTIWMAAALREIGQGGVLDTFDGFLPIRPGVYREAELVRGRRESVEDALREAGLASCVRLHKGRSSFEIAAMQPQLQSEGGVQLAYIDGDHEYAGVCHDLWAIEPVLQTGGFVIFHDVFPEFCGWDGPRQLLDNINRVARGRYAMCDVALGPVNYGLTILRRVG
ncbi:MAG: O-methyltransferase [Phycisphaerales bacterium JB039]